MAKRNVAARRAYYESYGLAKFGRAKLRPNDNKIDFYQYDVVTDSSTYHSSIDGRLVKEDHSADIYVWGMMGLKFSSLVVRM